MSSIFPLPAPTLPEFDALLVKGNYHASAPIHLALSYAYAHDAAKVVVLAPSRTHLTADVRKAKDGFLCKNGGNGVVANASRRVEMLYPPTPSHLELLLSLFHEALQDEKDFLHQKTTFSVTPSLIVLCEPSAYFFEARQATVSSYLTVVTQTLSLVNLLAEQRGQPVAFALFDSKLDQLQLPILPPPADSTGTSERNPTRPGPRRESVAELVRRYFGWIGTIEDANTDDNMHSFHLTRTQTDSSNNNGEVIWRYTKRIDDSGYVTYDFESP